MKKWLICAIATFAVASQAASFNWGTGTVKVAFDGSTILDGTATGYLVFLGTSSDVSKLYTVTYAPPPGTITGATKAAGNSEKASTSTGLANAKGRITATGYGGGTSDLELSGGMKFGMYITYKSEGTQWFNFSDTVYTVDSAIDTDPSASLSDATFSFDFGTKTQITSSSQTPSAGGGWYSISVPEPSTAMLALAGLALLIKRRKA